MSTELAKEPVASSSNTDVGRSVSVFDEMDRIMERIERRAFNLFKERGSTSNSAIDDWFRAESELLKPARVEIKEKEDEVIVRAQVPGFEAKELSVHAEPNRICIYGKSEKKTESDKKGDSHDSEMSSSEVCRYVSLPTNVNPEKASASLDKGVLEIRLPKTSAPKLVEVKVVS